MKNGFEGEEWRPIPGWEGAYEVSSKGRVRGVSRVSSRGRRVPGRELKGWVNSFGYRWFSLYGSEGETRVRAHRVVAEVFIPNPFGLPNVLHGKNGVSDNSVANLYWGDQSRNNLDKVRDGTDHNAIKTHCLRGHLFSEENTYRDKKGGRVCRTCYRDYDRRRRSTPPPPGDPRHGTMEAARSKCKCDPCKEVSREYYRVREQKRRRKNEKGEADG